MSDPWNWLLQTASGSLEFGDDLSPVVVSSWRQEPGKLRVVDVENPSGDGLRFGKDRRAGQTISFSMWVNGGDEAGAAAGLAGVAGVWRNDVGRSRAGGLARLRHPGGRSVVGRPRRLTNDSSLVERGLVTIDADFECVDDLWYGPEQVQSISFVAPVSGGLMFPAESPFTFDSGPTVRNGSVVVSGDVATWPVFEIDGPVTNPEVDVPGVGRLVFRTTLAYDQTLVVDTRPWARWVKRDGAAFPGALSASGSRLSDMALSPGAHTVLLRGYDPSGTAVLRVRTFPAFTSF